MLVPSLLAHAEKLTKGLSQVVLNLHLRQSFFYSLKKKACKKEKCLEKRQK